MKNILTQLLVLATLSTTAWAAPQAFDFKDPKGVNNVQFKLDAPLESITGTATGVSGNVSFDALEALRMTLALVTPFLADVRVKDAYDAARAALDASANMPAAIASSHRDRIDEAIKAVARPAHATLEAVVERALLESRAWSTRNVFGTSMVRALVEPSGVANRSSAVPAYLDSAAATRLPRVRQP